MRFNFLDWMNMSMAVDIAFLVFAVAVVWKFIRLQKNILSNQSKLHENKQLIEDNKEKIILHKAFSKKMSERIDLQSKVMVEMGENIIFIKDDLEIVMRNPQEARRVLKRREKQDKIEQ